MGFLHAVLPKINHISIQTVLFALVVSLLIYIFLKKRHLPPGPVGLPLLGYWPFLYSDTCNLKMQKLQRRYGDIFSFTANGKLFISLGSLKIIKETHLTRAECFGDRCLDFGVLSFPFEDGIAFINGEAWKELRKFFLQFFKDYGLTVVKDEAASCVYQTVQETIADMHSMNGKPLNVGEFFTMKCLIIMKRIMFNDQGITMEELKEMNEEYGPVLAVMDPKNMLLIGNIAKYFIFPFMSSYRAMVKSHKRIQTILGKVIERHKANYDEKQILDIIDSFIKERNEKKRKGDPTAVYFTDKSLFSSIYEFLGDGILTVAYFIGIYLASLVEHPEEQERIYQEIMEVVGSQRLPTLADKSKLPYTNAFLHEVLRFCDLFTFFPSQQCTRETTINGYVIPVGAITLINMWSVHHDERIYKDPLEFKPSRFISTPGKPREELPIGFGIGKRACMGEAFVMTQMFLFISSIVQNFRLSMPPDSKDIHDLIFQQGTLEICAYPRTHKDEASF